MQPTACDIYEYNSSEYKDCIKDIVYEAAQDEWIMLDPRFPNLKGVTPERIDNFLETAESGNMRNYFEDYLQHVMTYDRDDIFKMCVRLGDQIERKYPGKLHDSHSIFITTPRGGHEVLSIFAYANDLKKEQIPSHIRNINKSEQKVINRAMKSDKPGFITAWTYGVSDIPETAKDIAEAFTHIQYDNLPIIPDIWLETMSNYFRNKVETVFIIDDIIASGEQMIQAVNKIYKFFNGKIEIVPIVLIKRHDFIKIFSENIEKTIYDTETVGIRQWDEAQSLIEDQRKGWGTPKPELVKAFDSLITVRFPWGAPDGESDKILTKLYEGRRGLERIERKQRRCILTPDKCELK